jgi:hypothetical protein
MQPLLPLLPRGNQSLVALFAPLLFALQNQGKGQKLSKGSLNPLLFIALFCLPCLHEATLFFALFF